MPTYIEINGIDETGSVGEPIIFVRLGISLLNEIQIILRNVEHFDKLMASKAHLKGYETKTLFKYVLDFVDDPSIDITIFRMFPKTQLRLMKALSFLTGQKLFQWRRSFISMFDNKGNLIKADAPTALEISEIVSSFRRFRKPSIWFESFVKSYGMMVVTKRIGQISKSLSKPGFTDHFLVIQIDGGYPFAFWWKDLLAEKNPSFKKGSFVVSGVSSGDCYYPSMSTAGAIALSLFRNIEKLHLFPVYPVEYNEELELDDFCEKHGKAMETHYFQNRMLFIGNIDYSTKVCIPYLAHLRDRKITYEPTSIRMPIEPFFKSYGRGSPENTVIVQGSSLSTKDKQNLKFCSNNGYPISHISDFKDNFDELINKLDEEIQYAPTQKKKSLSSKLKKIEQECISNLK